MGQLFGWKSSAVTVGPSYYTSEAESYQLLEARSITNPTPNVLDVAKPAWAPTLALINPYSPRILFPVLRITSSPRAFMYSGFVPFVQCL